MEIKKDKEVKIRDLRKKEKFVIDDAYLNGYAKLCGIYATGVYMALCRHSNKDQYCFPSYQKMSEELAISIASVKRGVAKLLEWKVIEVIREKKTDGKWKNNAYILRDKSEWKSKPEVYQSYGEKENQGSVVTEPEVCENKSQRSVVIHKETQYEGNTYKDIPAHSAGDPVNQIINLFYETVNPTINYKNEGTRNAAKYLINKFGLEKIIVITKYATKIQGQKYAPTITTPYQLKEKLAELRIFMLREKAKEKEKNNKVSRMPTP